MVLFTRKRNGDTTASIEAELAALVERRTQLELQHENANSVLAAATDSRARSWLEADLSDQEASIQRDRAVREAQDRCGSLASALAEITGKISEANGRLDTAKDRIARQAESRSRSEQTAAIEQALTKYQSAAAQLAYVVKVISAVAPESASPRSRRPQPARLIPPSPR